MKNSGKALSILLILTLILTFMPVMAFADDEAAETEALTVENEILITDEEKANAPLEESVDSVSRDGLSAAAADDITYPDAAFTITDKDDRAVSLQFDYMTNTFRNFPKEGDKIRVFYDGNTGGTADEVFTFSKAENSFVGNTYTWLRWGVYETDYSTRSVGIRVNRKYDDGVYDSGHYYYIRQDVDVDVYRAPLKSLSYSPSSFRVYSENIKEAEYGGGYFYSFTNRVQHNAGGKRWRSAFAVGDTITATFEDGSTIRYKNKDAVGNGGYYDFFVNGDEMFMGKTENYKLHRGDNKVTVYLYMSEQPNTVKTTVDVFMWTPDMGPYPGDYADPSGGDDPEPSGGGSGSSDERYCKIKEAVDVAVAKLVKARESFDKIRISWKGLTKKQRKKVSKIQVQYSTSKNFDSPETKSVYVKKNKKSYTTKKLKKGTYYTRIRNIRKVNGRNYPSKWSKVKKVRIK